MNNSASLILSGAGGIYCDDWSSPYISDNIISKNASDFVSSKNILDKPESHPVKSTPTQGMVSNPSLE